MKIVCALNRAKGYVTHQSIVSWTGRGCNPDDLKYINDDMINPALDFITKALDRNHKVFIYCSLGESRSLSIALMYLLENGLIDQDDTIAKFKSHYYNNYSPKGGNLKYIQNRWLKKSLKSDCEFLKSDKNYLSIK